jgi:hypothetical protein
MKLSSHVKLKYPNELGDHDDNIPLKTRQNSLVSVAAQKKTLGSFDCIPSFFFD